MADVALRTVLPAQTAAGATSVTIMGEVPTTFAQTTYQVQRASLTSPTAVTGVATNNFTVNFRNLRGGTPQATFSTATFGLNTNLAVEVPFAATGGGTTTAVTVNAGDLIDVQLVQNGTGLAVPVGIVASVELA